MNTRDQIALYVACVFSATDCVEVRRLPSAESSWHNAAALAEFADSLARDNDRGQNIHVGANPRKGAQVKGDDGVELARCLFADFDKTTVDDALARVKAAGLPTPTLIIASGHGAHVYWRFDEPFTDLAEWRKIQKDLIALLGSDPAIHNPERLMRLSGFTNHKQPAAECHIVDADPTRVYSLADVLPLIPMAREQVHRDATVADETDAPVQEGGRNRYLTKLGGGMRRQGMTVEAIESALLTMNQQRCSPPLEEDEVRGIAESVSRYDPTPDADDLSPLRPAFKSARQLLTDHPSLRKPVIHGLLREGETMNVIAASKTGKSWLVSDLALSIASGRMWLGRHQIERGEVLILDNELHSETTANRLPKVAEARGMTSDEWVDHVQVENLRGRLVDVLKMRRYFKSIEPGRFKVIILDAFYRFMPKDSDENDNGTLASIYNELDRHAARLRCAFILIHHSSKGGQGEKAVTDVGAGAGAQSRATDTHLILRAHQEDGVFVMDAASRSWPPIKPLCIRWNFPIFASDETLDPAQLRKNRNQRERVERPKEPQSEPWTVARFVAAYVTSEPVNKKAIIANAEVAGLSARKAETLLTAAESGGKVHRWTFPKGRTVYLANRQQPVTECVRKAG